MSDSVVVSNNKQTVVKATEKAMKQAAMMIGGTVEGHAKELCPVDTGLLRNSITYTLGGQAPAVIDYTSNDKDKNGKMIDPIKGHYEGTAPEDDDDQITVYVGTNVQYAPYQELGAPNINLDARPFLRPAFENFTKEIEQIMEKCLKSIK